ncbi:MAG: hypothetical protein PHQ25_02815 [Acidobacteriota bacterium]|nr:hypothetical protein [Acidobacteriota bacterium]
MKIAAVIAILYKKKIIIDCFQVSDLSFWPGFGFLDKYLYKAGGLDGDNSLIRSNLSVCFSFLKVAGLGSSPGKRRKN